MNQFVKDSVDLSYSLSVDGVIGKAAGKLDLGEDPNNFLDGKNEDDYDDVVTEDEALEEYASEEANIQDSKDVTE